MDEVNSRSNFALACAFVILDFSLVGRHRRLALVCTSNCDCLYAYRYTFVVFTCSHPHPHSCTIAARLAWDAIWLLILSLWTGNNIDKHSAGSCV